MAQSLLLMDAACLTDLTKLQGARGTPMTFRIVFTTSIIKPHREVQISMLTYGCTERADSIGEFVVFKVQMESCWQSAALIMLTKRISLCRF